MSYVIQSSKIDGFCLWLYDKVYSFFLKTKHHAWKRPKEVILGYTQGDIINDWIHLRFSGEHLVVLFDIDISGKPVAFWDNIPDTKRIVFANDIVVLRCKDMRQVENIVYSVEKEFATAFGYRNGKLEISNEEY